MRLGLALFIVLSACTGAEPVTVVVMPSPTAEPPACETVALDACAQTAGCSVITGSALETDAAGELCAGDFEAAPIACQATKDCPAVEIYGRETASTTPYLIPGGCLPEGWESLPGPVAECVPEVGDVCANVDLASCATTDGCYVVRGRILENQDTEACIDYSASYQALTCQAESEAGCGDAETVASMSQTTPLYLFPNTCIPTGWRVNPAVFDECTPTCADTLVSDCAVAGCQLITGRPLQDDGAGGLCEDPVVASVALACMDPAPCGDAISYASDGTTTYWFADTCTPPSFTADSGPYPSCP